MLDCTDFCGAKQELKKILNVKKGSKSNTNDEQPKHIHYQYECRPFCIEF